jgi:hypothetical protein
VKMSPFRRPLLLYLEFPRGPSTASYLEPKVRERCALLRHAPTSNIATDITPGRIRGVKSLTSVPVDLPPSTKGRTTMALQDEFLAVERLVKFGDEILRCDDLPISESCNALPLVEVPSPELGAHPVDPESSVDARSNPGGGSTHHGGPGR